MEKGLESLVVWQKTQQFAVNICKSVLPMFPDQEKFALSSQLRRSVQSIPANVAEGYGRFYYQEGVRFGYIARGSLEETYSHLSFARKMDYISQDQFLELQKEMSELKRLINGFINYLKQSKELISEPAPTYTIESGSGEELGSS